MTFVRIFTLILTLIAIVAIGTVFFHFVEGWSWIDAYFFTVITLSTVGYGSLVPATTIGKIATTIFIFVGLGVFAVAIQQFGTFTMRKREEHTERLMAHLGRSDHEKESAEPANNPEAPEATEGKDR